MNLTLEKKMKDIFKMIVTNVQNPRDLTNDSDLKNSLEHYLREERISDFRSCDHEIFMNEQE